MKQLKLIIMHFILACNVLIGDLDASPFIHSIEVKSGWRDLTDEATIKLPKILQSSNLIDILPGQEVIINLGYEDYQHEVFHGYVKQVNPKTPLEIVCEDATYALKRVTISKTWTGDVTLKEIIQHVIDETNSSAANEGLLDITLNDNIPEITFSKFRIAKVNAAVVLQKLKEAYPIIAYFDDHELHVHLPYSRESLGEVEYDLTNNVINHDRLEYRDLNQNAVRIEGINTLESNELITVNVGDDEGTTVQKTYKNIKDEAMLRELATQDLQDFKFEGYKGSLRSFMVPYARHSMKARIVDPDYGTDAEGNYLRESLHDIEETVIKFDSGITIDVGIGVKE